MELFDNLNEVKSQLFDAPAEVKSAFNDVVKYFSDPDAITFYIGGTVTTVAQALKDRGHDSRYATNEKVLLNPEECYTSEGSTVKYTISYLKKKYSNKHIYQGRKYSNSYIHIPKEVIYRPRSGETYYYIDKVIQ